MDPDLTRLATAIASSIVDELDSAGNPSTLFLGLARVFPVAFFAPWLATRNAPVVVRGCLVAVLSMGLISGQTLAAGSGLQAADPTSSVAFLGAAVRELVLGSFFALASSVPFLALAWAGELSDLWRGAPSTSARGSDQPLSTLFSLVALVLFWTAGGGSLCIELYRLGFEHLPLGGAAPLGQVAFATGTIRLTATALGFGLAVATPTAVSVFLFDMARAAWIQGSGRMSAPSGQSFRAMAGLWGAFLALSVFAGEFDAVFRDGFRDALVAVSKMAS